MNNTKKRNLTAISAILIAATLVVGTLVATTTIATQSAFAYPQKKKVAQHDDKGKHNEKGNGNTDTNQNCNINGPASGLDPVVSQECEPLICTHPNNNATCSEEEVTSSTITAAGNNTVPVNACEQCFTSLLKPQQISDVTDNLKIKGPRALADLCALLEQNKITDGVFLGALSDAGVSDTTINELIKCLFHVGIVFQ